MNTPEDIDRKYIHSVSDRVCCFLPITCQRVSRLKDRLEGTDNEGYDAGIYTVDKDYENDEMRMKRQSNGSNYKVNGSYYRGSIEPADNDDSLTKL